ncbi:hypothetical protein DQG23_13840 [Paenibacillus contaminans]|uniref:AAA domain-containing protein n=1 Tax=Paenibacillus contaminans TaxID=450362 RepID=A0A329MLW0_9BACL|nr:hypothetical protein DQG23_13840 [Paenibacillus contaminans]
MEWLALIVGRQYFAKGRRRVGKLVLCVLDDDFRYLESLARYLGVSAHGNDFILKCFSKPEGLVEYLRMPRQADVLLAKPGHLIEIGMASGTIAVGLIGDAGDNALMAIDLPRVNKYQPLDQMFATISEFVHDRIGRGGAEDGGQMRVVSVYSATGGSGKSTVAANMAKIHAFRDWRVFYLNLELLQSPAFFRSSTETEKQSFSKWMYFVLSGERHSSARLAGLASKDPERRVAFFEPVSDMEEMEQITFADARKLIEAIKSSGEYDELIIDLDASISERVLGAISASDEVAWIFTDDIQSLTKTGKLFGQLNKKLGQKGDYTMPHHTFVMNKFTGAAVHNPADFGIRSHVKLPYIPAWKSVRHTGQLLEEPVFQEHLISVLGRRGLGGGGCDG